MNKFRFLFLILSINLSANAQNIIKGNAKDETGKPADNVNLILYPKQGETILGYSISDGKGSYSISYTGSIDDSLRLEITSISYAKKTIYFVGKANQNLNIVLQTAINKLPEVEIKDEKPIRLKGDTINYNPSFFADKNDRVVIDVIKKLPGITVDANGQIKYQNKPINKFYVEGKDLLEDRYSIASNNLPIDAVDKVQILQNHQTIKLLEDIEQSDRAAINIKLNSKAKFKLLGNGIAGLGLLPFLHQSNLSLLKFNKEIQYINTIKNNNIGKNLANEFTDYISNNNIESGSFNQNLVNLVKPSPPPVQETRYWFNNNSLVNGNYLIGLSSLFNLKFNVGYINDYLIDQATTTTKIYLPTDTIVINENQTGSKNYNKLLVGMVLEANTKKIYLREAIKLQRIWSLENNFITSKNITQQLNNPYINFSNEIGGLLHLTNNLIGLNSYTSFTNLPQQLNVTPGQYNSILNNNVGYDAVLQKVQLKNFYTNNSVSYGKLFGAFTFNQKIGLSAQLQTLSNSLSLNQNNVFSQAVGNYANIIDRANFKIYYNPSLNYNAKKINGSLDIDLNANWLSNKEQDITQHSNKYFINPRLNIRYDITSFWQTSINYSTFNYLAYNANTSYILQNYRSLLNSNTPLSENSNQTIRYNINYKNIINAVYGNFSIGYTHSVSNILADIKYNNALVTQTAIEQYNPSNTFSLAANINKYYLTLKTSFDLSVAYEKKETQQLQQNLLTNFNAVNLTFAGSINSKISNALSLSHNVVLTKFKNTNMQSGVLTNYSPIVFLQQSLAINMFLPNNFSAKLNAEHYFNNANNESVVNYFFADATFQKSITKPKLDFSIQLSNLLNTKAYTSYAYTNNYFITSNYSLRKQMAIFKVAFQF